MTVAIIQTLQFIFWATIVVINLIILYRVLIGFPAQFEEQRKINQGLSNRIKKLEYPDEEETSLVFRDEPDWLR